MRKETIKTAETVDEALALGYAELGVGAEDAGVGFEILELPKKGFLGLKKTEARVLVYAEQSKADAAVDYLRKVLEGMGLTAEFSVEEDEKGAVITLSGDDLGVIIGRRGETLDALQYLAGLVANRGEGSYYRISLDSNNYREKRVKTLQSLAARLARQVAKTGRSTTLEPMNPFERRIIHSTVQTVEGVKSASIGEEPNRRVVISSTNPKSNRRSDRGGRNRSERRDHSDAPKHSAPRTSTPKVYDIPPRPAQERPAKKSDFESYLRDENSDFLREKITPTEAENKPLYAKIDLDNLDL